jgi:hypothetical protein
MSRLEESFNRSWLSRFLNSFSGRVYRLAAGLAFIVVGFIYSGHLLGVLSILWGIFPLSAGAFDICYISVVLGGPISGKTIRTTYQHASTKS